jgi:PleD family two-component response regulator
VGFPCKGVRKPEDMIRNADRAMYEAKRAGRNRIMLFSAGPAEGG